MTPIFKISAHASKKCQLQLVRGVSLLEVSAASRGSTLHSTTKMRVSLIIFVLIEDSFKHSKALMPSEWSLFRIVPSKTR